MVIESGFITNAQAENMKLTLQIIILRVQTNIFFWNVWQEQNIAAAIL